MVEVSRTFRKLVEVDWSRWKSVEADGSKCKYIVLVGENRKKPNEMEVERDVN